ncbi:hypothetical protein PYCCODRAFT_1266067 [Trametes coccinea BRFM310]|uniref:Uncharacterized protein n=1 Tax=Trametes coccinea (strain BRFM310) TaxID=1353009 RepID=A0A1Y2I5Z8_TRAC3|nr:hypothetical protein PYCCODRAFT_1266067 [Trametes coccinea BRFM310]
MRPLSVCQASLSRISRSEPPPAAVLSSAPLKSSQPGYHILNHSESPPTQLRLSSHEHHGRTLTARDALQPQQLTSTTANLPVSAATRRRRGGRAPASLLLSTRSGRHNVHSSALRRPSHRPSTPRHVHMTSSSRAAQEQRCTSRKPVKATVYYREIHSEA